MKHILTIFLLICFSTGFIFSQDEQGFKIKVLNSSSTSTTLEYIVDDYNYKEMFIEGEKYLFYDIPGMIWLMEKGLPQLPVIRNSIIIPDLAGMNIRIIDQKFETIETIPVMPSKGHFTRNIHPSTVPYSFSNMYKEDVWYPQQNIQLDIPYVVRDLRGQTVQFNPMQYNGVEGKLRICRRLVVEIYADNNVAAVNPFNRVNKLNAVSGEFVDIYNNLFLNYGTGPHDYVPIPEPGRLLIVYPAAFASKVTPFYEWKLQKGIPTLLAEYPTQTGTGSAALKTYIQNLYNSTDGITYIILIGESNQIPTISGVYEGAPSDPCYVKLAGTDAYPDAYISRISPTSEANLGYVLWKIMRYEKFPDGGINGAWYFKGIGVASNEGSPPDWTYANTLRDMLINNMHFTDVDQIYDPGANASMVTTALNNGRSVINYIGHGSGTSWSTSYFNNSSIHALTNGYKNPFIIDVACLNGNFTMSECMEEAWIRAGDSVNAKGAIAAYGASTNASWIPPLHMQKEAMMLLTTKQRQTVGGVCFNGVMKGMDLYGGSTGEGLRMMEQYNIFGDCTTMLTFGLIPDSTAPMQVTDLNAIEPTSNSIKVVWTSPFDSSLGGVVSYDLRCSSTPIVTETDFNNADCIIVPGAPDSAGISKSYIYRNLNSNTEHYFAIKSKDMWGNTSEMSNTTSLSTYQAPAISVSPAEISVNLLNNVFHKDTVLISNVTSFNSTLDYSISLENNSFPGDYVTANILPFIKEELTEDKNNPSDLRGYNLKGSGGPDYFGYEWIDSDDPSGPQYIWEDILTTGTKLTNWTAISTTWNPKDEGYAGPINFNFKFYGQQHTQIYANSNGFLTFNICSTTSYTNATIPTAAQPNGYIAPFWDDLDGASHGDVYYKISGDKIIIQYEDWAKYGASADHYTFQIVLSSSGRIMFYYKTMSGTLSSATVGLENQTGSGGLLVAYNSTYLKNNLAVKLQAEPDWVAGNTNTGTLYNGNSAIVELTFRTEDYPLGQYSMDMVITSNDPLNDSIIVPISLLLNEVPVELSSFTATSDRNSVVLSWETATEVNNEGFKVERALAGETGKMNSFNEAGFVKGNGSSTEKNSYTFTDKNLNAGIYRYRLVQVDYSGEVSYSPVIEVDLNIPNEYALLQNYPNPFNPTTTIEYTLPEKSDVEIIIYSILGDKVAEILRASEEAGYKKLVFNASGLSSGIYFYTIIARGETELFSSSRKMVILK
jgi:hypothetical protein